MRAKALLFTVAVVVLGLASATTAAAQEVAKYQEQIEATSGLLVYLPLQSEDDPVPAADAVRGRVEYASGPGAGQAMVFAENAFLSLGPTPQLDTPQTTVELWFRADFSVPAPYNPCLIAKRAAGDHTQTRWSVHLEGDLSTIDLWNGQAVARYAPPGGSLEAGRWYHLAVVMKENETTVFLNGVPCLAQGGSWTLNAGRKELPLNLASSQPTGAEFFRGAIAHVAVYGEALSPDTLAAHTDALGFRAQRLIAEDAREKAMAEKKRRERELAESREKAKQELMNDPALFARGELPAFVGDHLAAVDMPVGGVGVGAVHMNGRAERHAWQIFYNFAYTRLPHSFFAVRAQTPNGPAVVRSLQTSDVGPFRGMTALRLQAKYPLAWYEFADEQLPVHVTLETFNPMIPLNARDSAIPCAVYNIILENPTAEPLRVDLLGAQQNAVGYHGNEPIRGRSHPRYGGNLNRVEHTQHATRLTMRQLPAEKTDSMVLLLMDPEGEGTPVWSDIDELHRGFQQAGTVGAGGNNESPRSPDGETFDGALTSRVDLQPGEKVTVSFVLTWYFPGGDSGAGNWGCTGRRYEKWWKDAGEVADELESRLPELTETTRLYCDSVFETNLPYWLVHRITSQTAILRSPTVFWCSNGYFGGWEGCNLASGCCHGNCNHVWHYAQAHARLFPQIARQMREQEFRFQAADGAIPHRQPASFPAFDGQCGAVLNSYREHLMSPDASWLQANWPRIRQAMNYVIARWDSDEDGVPTGPQWNTLDGELAGTSSWLGSLYIAALEAAAQMARIESDDDAARRYAAIASSGSRKQDEMLFNGEYYIQVPGETPHEDYGEACAIDQVLGQWWAQQLDLAPVYPLQHVQSALESLFSYNFRGRMEGLPQLPRKFAADEDAGLQMFVWPEGTEPPPRPIRYASEVMTGFEYSAAAAMIQAGLLREGFTVCRAIDIRYDGRRRENVTGASFVPWRYCGNPFGDDECGKFYARAMSVWSVLLACQGYAYDGPAGEIGFRPLWKPEDHVSFFTAAEGWGVYRQQREADCQRAQLELRHGSLYLTRFEGELPKDTEVEDVTLKAGDRKLAGDFHLDTETGHFAFRFHSPVSLEAGDTLRIDIATNPEAANTTGE